jgi:tetratricopeptide (TPR) repeat protein
MLNLSEPYRPVLKRFIESMAAGVEADAAFARAVARPLAKVERDLRRYIAQDRFLAVVERIQPPARLERLEPETLAAPAPDLALAELLGAMRKYEPEAEALYRRILDKFPDCAEAHARLARIENDRRNAAAARTHFEQAFAAGFKDARAHYHYARLLRASGAPLDEVLKQLRAALAIDPKRARVWHDTALVLQEMGQVEFALSSARQGLKMSGTAEERRTLESLVKWLEQVEAVAAQGPRVQVARAPAVPAHAEDSGRARLVRGEPRPEMPVVQQASESLRMPEGNARAEGTLLRLDCLKDGARYHLRTSAGVLKVWVADPSRVALRNTGEITMEFNCGALQPRQVTLEYTAVPDASRGTAGVLTAIEFGK